MRLDVRVSDSRSQRRLSVRVSDSESETDRLVD